MIIRQQLMKIKYHTSIHSKRVKRNIILEKQKKTAFSFHLGRSSVYYRYSLETKQNIPL